MTNYTFSVCMAAGDAPRLEIYDLASDPDAMAMSIAVMRDHPRCRSVNVMRHEVVMAIRRQCDDCERGHLTVLEPINSRHERRPGHPANGNLAPDRKRPSRRS